MARAFGLGRKSKAKIVSAVTQAVSVSADADPQTKRKRNTGPGEVCDPVEDDQYAYQIGDILVTDFVTPNWFAHTRRVSSTSRATPALRSKSWQAVTHRSSIRNKDGSRSLGPRRGRANAPLPRRARGENVVLGNGRPGNGVS
jgi:hypothetical protein